MAASSPHSNFAHVLIGKPVPTFPGHALCFRYETISHPAERFNLGVHHIAGLEERVGALSHSAAGAATENISRLQREHVRGVFDLLFRREDELRRIAVLL